MNNKCNNCAKFLTCNRKECKKVTFIEAGILDKPKRIKKRNYNAFAEAGISTQELIENLVNVIKSLKTIELKEQKDGSWKAEEE